MRLIDADALINRIVFHTDWSADEKEAFEDEINAEPSIEPERKIGIWKNRSLNILYPEWERYECSACGGYSYNHKFCPNCGADMREGDQP